MENSITLFLKDGKMFLKDGKMFLKDGKNVPEGRKLN
jgi:hypothetical protein